jgi:hypothetical protein
MHPEGQKISAEKLPSKQKEELKRLLQFELTAALIASIKANPPEVDLAKVEVVMPAGAEFDVARLSGDCGTCGTCSTCGTSSGIKRTIVEVA